MFEFEFQSCGFEMMLNYVSLKCNYFYYCDDKIEMYAYKSPQKSYFFHIMRDAFTKHNLDG